MKTKLKPILALSLIGTCLASTRSEAAVVVGTANQNAGAPDVASFTPTFVIGSTNNVLAGLTPSASAGNFDIEFSGGLPVLTDGQFGAMNNDGGPTATHPALATFGNGGGAGSTITYSFAPTQLTGIYIYGGWNDAGRDQQSYTVQYSINGVDFLDIAVVDYNPTGTTGQSANEISITDSSGLLAGGASITDLRINANTTENGYAGLAEIAAYAVPEPGVAMLGAIGALGLLRRRRALTT